MSFPFCSDMLIDPWTQAEGTEPAHSFYPTEKLPVRLQSVGVYVQPMIPQSVFFQPFLTCWHREVMQEHMNTWCLWISTEDIHRAKLAQNIWKHMLTCGFIAHDYHFQSSFLMYGWTFHRWITVIIISIIYAPLAVTPDIISCFFPPQSSSQKSNALHFLNPVFRGIYF